MEAAIEAGFRAHARRAVHLRATVRLEGSAWQSDGTVLNVGLGGACVALARTPSIGAPVLVAFAAPTLNARHVNADGDPEPFSLRARVQWLRPPTSSEPARAGLAFDHTSPGDLQLFVDFLATL